ncbi:MAG TPA: hypothetical protein VNG89_07455, partial [Vicinamibacterales bacterium]|nr:hypothetical protein [Vicinamibacterales bacterium]
MIEFLKSLQMLPPGTRDLVVDDQQRPRPWPLPATAARSATNRPLPEVELRLSALRQTVLPAVRRPSVAAELGAQPVRAPLHALPPAEVVR